MPRPLPLLVVIAALAFAAAASAGPEVSRLVDVSFQDEGLHRAAEKLFKGNNLPYRVEPGVPNVPITYRLKGVPVDAAINALLRVGRSVAPQLELLQSDGTWVLRMGTAALADPPYEPEKDPRLARKVTAEGGPTLRKALASILEPVGIPYVVTPIVPELPVRVSVKDQTVQEALAAFMQQVGVQAPTLYLGVEQGVVFVGFRSTPALQGKAAGLPGPDRKGSVSLVDVKLRGVLRLLYRDSGLQIEVAEDVPDVAVSLRVRDRTLDQAVDQLLDTLREVGVEVSVQRSGKTHRFTLKKA